jgi:hypothetical protein
MLQGAEGQDQRLDPKAVDERAVRYADSGAQRHHRHEHRQQQLGAAVGDGAAQHDREAEQLADREVDQPAGDDEGLADRHQSSAADWVTTFARLVGEAKPGTNSSAAASTTASSP